MTGEKTIRTVIVDDEPLARDAVRTLLADDPEIEIVGEASNGVEAIEVVRSEKPDLLFLDVQMPDLGGFGVLRSLGDDVPPALIFVTAHDEHALRAFEVHALDYVLKPFGKERLGNAVARAKRQLTGGWALEGRAFRSVLAQDLDGPDPGELDDEQTTPRTPERLGIRRGSRVVLVTVSEVDWIEADGDYVRLHVGEKNHLLNARMGELEERLGPAGFQRVHRSTIVNIDRVSELDRDPEGGGAVILSDGTRLRVAESRWAELARALGLDL